MPSQKSEEREIDLLKRELEALGDALADERLERRSAFDAILLELEAMRRTLERRLPRFSAQCEMTRQEMIQSYDPEARS